MVCRFYFIHFVSREMRRARDVKTAFLMRTPKYIKSSADIWVGIYTRARRCVYIIMYSVPIFFGIIFGVNRAAWHARGCIT